MFSRHISLIYTEKQSLRTAFLSVEKVAVKGAFGLNIQGEKSIKLVVSFSLTTATQILRADRDSQPSLFAFALISAISFFIYEISTLSFSSHSSRVVAYNAAS